MTSRARRCSSPARRPASVRGWPVPSRQPARPSGSPRRAPTVLPRYWPTVNGPRPILVRGRSISPTSTRQHVALEADDALGGIDLLVNNAGIPKRKHTLDLTPDVVETVIRVNYFSPVRLTLALLPRMIDRGSGRILTVSSVAARLGPPREAAYSATKAGISTFMESLAVDLDGTDIRIHLVNPGIIDTELFHLPDNERSLSDLEALPVEALTDAVLKQLDDDVFEIYVPEWFVDIVSGRYANIGPFIEGSRQYVRERVEQMGGSA